MVGSAFGRVVGTGRSPTIHGWIVSPARVQVRTGISSPDNHLTADPDCRKFLSASGRVGCAGGCPTIAARIVSAACVEKVAVKSSAPDDHFSASPHCRVACPGIGRVGCGSGCPTVGARIVPPAGVQIGRAASTSTPDDHFSASPHCCVAHPGSGSVGCAGRCPRIINASVWAGRYCGKRILIALLSPSPEFQWFLMIGVEVSYKTLSQHRPSQTFSNYKRIIPQRCKHFAQHLGLVGVLCHAIHFSLQLLGSDWPMPVVLQRLRVAQIICDFLFELRLRHHCIERWLGIRAVFRPDAVIPVNLLDRSLISYAF